MWRINVTPSNTNLLRETPRTETVRVPREKRRPEDLFCGGVLTSILF